NVNVVSLNVGKLVDTSQGQGLKQTKANPLLLVQVWRCEFCGYENSVDESLAALCIGQRAGVRSDDLYLPRQSEDDYQNLEDTLVVFCVDTSGSMSVTTEVCGLHYSNTLRVKFLQSLFIKKDLINLLPLEYSNYILLVSQVVIYGDGTSAPITLRDWALVDYDHIWEKVLEVEHGATCLGPAALASVAMASRYPGSKVILCTDGKANIGLGEMEEDEVYRLLCGRVIISVMTFEGTDCRLADIGKLADATGGRVNIVSIGTVAREIESVSEDNVLATGVKATLYFPYEDENNHKLVREIGNVTKGLEITFQFAVKPDFMEFFLQKGMLPFQMQLSFKTRDQHRITRIITEHRIFAGRLNMAVLDVHCAQLCASLTMEGKVQEAQRQLKAQQDLLQQVSKWRPIQKEESMYGNWMETMTTICEDITTESQVFIHFLMKTIR
uniref:Circularly permutated Ras protein 1-like n=1 Tax=Pundamilia nyererei TaxID=303518 RepID=A0A3B4FJ08_9CICH